MANLLTDPLVQTAPGGFLTLPGVFAALVRAEVDSFPALRPHQQPAWHMFLVQLAGLALHGAGCRKIPDSEADWLVALRGLTPDFLNDEPWRLVVDDWSQPAFLQPPVPAGVELANHVSTPDYLDLLITSRNHDLKRAVARHGQPQDWLFSLVSLQTMEGFGGRGNYGIARMNGGSSSRPLLGLAPLSSGVSGKNFSPRPGEWFYRDLSVLLESRAKVLADCGLFSEKGGIGLLWVVPWPEGHQLQVRELDLWFIEVCRRVRLRSEDDRWSAMKGNSQKERIAAKNCKGVLADPWAPSHKSDNKSFTLGEGDFDYRRLSDLLFSGDWILPLLAQPSSFESGNETMALVAAALSRGNSKTDGFKMRILPIGGKVTYALMNRRKELHLLAQAQMDEIKIFDKALSGALALVAVGGDWEKRKKEHYEYARSAQISFSRDVDAAFFPSLWRRFAAQEQGDAAKREEEQRFARLLLDKSQLVFAAALPSVPCASVFRPRAEARARRAFTGAIYKHYSYLFSQPEPEDTDHAPA
ncbi:MAG: hypothetical protein U5J62_09690 [Desulfurivibrio sp.]|nr:hypothetical protein [Desulfurivibrio sp.]